MNQLTKVHKNTQCNTTEKSSQFNFDNTVTTCTVNGLGTTLIPPLLKRDNYRLHIEDGILQVALRVREVTASSPNSTSQFIKNCKRKEHITLPHRASRKIAQASYASNTLTVRLTHNAIC